jgi:hypothetical protein
MPFRPFLFLLGVSAVLMLVPTLLAVIFFLRQIVLTKAYWVCGRSETGVNTPTIDITRSSKYFPFGGLLSLNRGKFSRLESLVRLSTYYD